MESKGGAVEEMEGYVDEEEEPNKPFKDIGSVVDPNMAKEDRDKAFFEEERWRNMTMDEFKKINAADNPVVGEEKDPSPSDDEDVKLIRHSVEGWWQWREYFPPGCHPEQPCEIDVFRLRMIKGREGEFGQMFQTYVSRKGSVCTEKQTQMNKEMFTWARPEKEDLELGILD